MMCKLSKSARFRDWLTSERHAYREATSARGVFGLVFMAVAAGILLAGHASAAEPEWKVGLAHAKITPERPVQMAGYSSRTKPFAKVTADLFVKALVLEDGKGHRGVIVTSDIIGFQAAVSEPICERIRQKAGLKREQILISSSHNHAGPLINLDVPAKDDPSSGEKLRTVEYTRRLQDTAVDVVVKALSDLKPARLSWGTGVATFVMNRRQFTPNGGVRLGHNPRGLADRSVPVLRVDGADGKLRAVLFQAGAHNTTLGGENLEICGEYAGYAETYIEEHHPKVQAMFMLGCAGDANPYPRGTMELARKHGTTLGEEVCRVLDTKLRPISGPLQIAFDRVDLPLQTALTVEELKKFAKGGAKAFCAVPMLAMLEKGQKPPTHYTCPVTVWQIGKELTLVALSGEVVVDYVPRLEKALGPNNLWVAAYCNDVFGYVPSARVIAEGGYETRGLYFGGAGYFDPKAEDILVKKVRDLAIKAGRKVPE